MTDSGIAQVREQEAREFIDRLISQGSLDGDLFGDHRNFKPWYSHRALFQKGIKRVYIGIDPGGDPMFPDNTTGPQYQTFLEGDSYNAFLDESWTGSVAGEAPLQKRTRRVFHELSGGLSADDELRQTACFNVCPLRTGESNNIQSALWYESVEWCKRVIEDLSPATIICNGSAMSGRSPWAAINVMQDWCAPVSRRAYLRTGIAHIGDTHATRVIGLPHLTGARYNHEVLFRLLSEHVELLVGHEKD